MGSDLEVLILILAAWHSAAKLPLDEANTTSAKSRDEMRKSPNSEQKRTHSCPCLCLDILSIKILNRIGTKVQPKSNTHQKQTYCQQFEPSSCSSCTETEQPLAESQWHLYSGSTTHGTTRDMEECLFQINRTHVFWLGKPPMNPKAPCVWVWSWSSVPWPG